MYKVYVKGSYLIVDKVGDKFLVEIPVDRAKIIKLKSSSNNYEFLDNKDVKVNLPLVDIIDANGDPYTSDSFDRFRFVFTGVDSISGGGFSKSGYSATGAFADKPGGNQYVWQPGAGVNITQSDVDAGAYKVFSLNRAVHEAVDNPYWSIPAPTGETGIGLFQGVNLPNQVGSLYDYDYVFNDNYPSNGSTGFEGTTGRIRLNDLQYGDQLRVRFAYNVIPQIANTTIEPALWYSNRDENDNITFTFALTTQPAYFGTGTVGKSYLNRVEISAWITSSEDVNALTLPAIKSDNPIIIQPLELLTTVIR